MRRRYLLLIPLAIASLTGRPARAQKPDSGAFIVRLGVDTLAVERYVRTPNQLVAEALLRTPQTRALKLTINFNTTGAVSSYELRNSPVAGVPNSGPVERTVVRYIGDGARIQSWSGNVVRPVRMVVTRGALLPAPEPFYSTYEAALWQARRARPAAPAIRLLVGSVPTVYQLHWLPNDNVTLSNPSVGTLHARLDRNGQLRTLSGENTTFKVLVTRTSWLDIAAYARRFAAADVQGRSLGVLSPRDTVIGALGTARLLVDYSRPAKRGRIVFGGLVPWRQVWRTGANAATQIQFGAPVEINGVAIPAGKYSLWSIPDPGRWQIIINRQTGQWGTEYNAAQDLARIAVGAQTLSVPVERFTIGMRRSSSSEAVMTLSWDRTRVVVPIKKRMAPSLPQRT